MSLLMDALKKAEEAKKTYQPSILEDNLSSGNHETLEEPSLQVLQQETLPLVEDEFPIETSPEAATSSWPPWEEDSKSDESVHTESTKESMNWDEQWLPEFSEDVATKTENPPSVEQTPVPLAPVFTLRDWQNESATQNQASNHVTLEQHESSFNEPSINADQEEHRSEREPVFPTTFEKTLYSQENTQETAQRILDASASPGSHQVKRFYGLLLIVVMILVGGGYYYYSISQNSSWLVASNSAKPFQSPFRKNPPEKTLPTENHEASIKPRPTSVESNRQNMEDHHLTPPKANQEIHKDTELKVSDNPLTQVAETDSSMDRQAVKGEHPPKEVPQADSLSLHSPKSPQPELIQGDKTSSSPSPIKKPSTLSNPDPVDSKLPSTPKRLSSLSPVAQEDIHRNKILKQQMNKELSEAYGAFQRGDNLIAQHRYQEALAKDQNNRDALLGLAALALQRREASVAQRYYRQILQLYPEDVHARVGLMTTLDYRAAGSEQQLKLLLEQAPQSSYIHFSLGNLYARQGRWSQAQRAYFDAYHYDNTKADYAYNLAISLDQLNQPQAALDYYQKALQLAKNQTVNFELSSVHRRVQTLLNYSRHLTKNFQSIHH